MKDSRKRYSIRGRDQDDGIEERERDRVGDPGGILVVMIVS